MPKASVRHPYWHLALVTAIALAIQAAYAVQQDNPTVDSGGSTVCANLGVYIFVGGTGGFDGLENGDQFTKLLQTGHVGLYEHANAVVEAEHPPSIIQAIESVFTGTGPGQAELGQVGANYFTVPPSYGYYQAVYIQNGLHPSEANVNTPSDTAPPGQLQKDLKLWREYVDAAKTVGIETVAPIVGPNDPNEPKLGDHVFATNAYYALERGEALYGKAIAFDVPPMTAKMEQKTRTAARLRWAGFGAVNISTPMAAPKPRNTRPKMATTATPAFDELVTAEL